MRSRLTLSRRRNGPLYECDIRNEYVSNDFFQEHSEALHGITLYIEEQFVSTMTNGLYKDKHIEQHKTPKISRHNRHSV